jgi:hypothetical protein
MQFGQAWVEREPECPHSERPEERDRQHAGNPGNGIVDTRCYDSSSRGKTAGRHRMARRETSLSRTLLYIVGIAEMRVRAIGHQVPSAGIAGRERRRDRHAVDHAEIARRLAGPRNGVVAAMDFVEGRNAGAEAITV